MAVKIGINGFGRIGRCVMRASLSNPEIEIVGVNDLTDPDTQVHLLKYNSVMGRLDADVEMKSSSLVINGRKTLLFSETDPPAGRQVLD